MITDEIQRCCGTCFYWQPEGGSDFSERCKYRFRRPYCSRDNKPRSADARRGCLGWKQSEFLK